MPGPPLLELFPFRFRDPVSGKWVKARYVAERHEHRDRRGRSSRSCADDRPRRSTPPGSGGAACCCPICRWKQTRASRRQRPLRRRSATPRVPSTKFDYFGWWFRTRGTQDEIGDLLHRLAQTLNIRNDVACRNIIAHLVVEQALD